MEAGNRRGSSCGSCRSKCWTAFYVFTWILLLIGTVLSHYAIHNLIGPLKDLPESLKKGFYDELKFDRLAVDSETLKTTSEEAMVSCMETAVQCENGAIVDPAACPAIDPMYCTRTYDNSARLTIIQDIFQSSLSVVNKVANDKYFGTDDLKKTADNLQTVVDQLHELGEETGDRCPATNVAYCEIYKAAKQLKDGADGATGAIDSLIESDFIDEFNSRTDYLIGMHALPYILMCSMFFFTCFWYRDAACWFCGGSFLGSIACCIHLIFWLLFFILDVIIVAVGTGLKHGQDRIELTGLKGEPTLEELLDHVSTTYPEFWGIVITPLEGPMELLYNAALIFLVFCFLILFYGFFVCICRPYRNNKVQDADA